MAEDEDTATAALLSAIALMGEALGQADLGNPLAGLTCPEAETIATVLDLAGQPGHAERVRLLHGVGDCEGEDAHHHVWLANNGPRAVAGE